MNLTIRIPQFLIAPFLFFVLTYRKLRYGYAFRRIPVTEGKFAIIDPEDFNEISKYQWFDSQGYAFCVKYLHGTIKHLSMHRFLLSDQKGKIVDHINRNRLDNRKANLRYATRSQNGFNRINVKHSSIYKGVFYRKVSKKWGASIRSPDKKIHLGLFLDEIEAAKVYDEAAKKYHGEFAVLNFPPRQKTRKETFFENIQIFRSKVTENVKNRLFGLLNFYRVNSLKLAQISFIFFCFAVSGFLFEGVNLLGPKANAIVAQSGGPTAVINSSEKIIKLYKDKKMIIEKYSFGIGDRFAHQGKAQLLAFLNARKQGVNIVPVWNKSHREHTIIHTEPMSVRKEADAAVKAMSWNNSYHVDADHIGLKNVDLFLEASDFYTLDVADFVGKPAPAEDIKAFVNKYKKYVGKLSIQGIDEKFDITEKQIEAVAAKSLLAVKEAGKIYRHIEEYKGKDSFITEVSMDETDLPQTPVEMFFILAAIADEGIPAQTIAPKFTGRFNKGVDYVGDVAKFAKEFEQDVAVIAFAIKEFGLPKSLKLSIHSGSDKFSLYGHINKTIKKFNAGLHVKTAGTTWLEELIGLAMAGSEGYAIAKEVYGKALSRFDELCGPYATVIDINKGRLPTPQMIDKWTNYDFASALRHDQSNSRYNRDLRQLLHVGYKVAAEMGDRYLKSLEKFETIIAQNVTENLFNRHIKPIFID